MAGEPKKKSPGFWFYTGDWMKDPELRFCSIFARGLLVDLLCMMFEAKQRGYLSKPDGTPRSDEQIVDAVGGGDRDEKLGALAELEASGVLSRDDRGVLYSRKLARLGELTEKRSRAGSKGGSKTQAKRKAKANQTEKQNRGVTDTDSVTDSELNTHTHHARERIPEGLEESWERWQTFREAIDGKRIPAAAAEQQLFNLEQRGIEKARRDIAFSIDKNARSVLDSDHDFQNRNGGGGKSRGDAMAEKMQKILLESRNGRATDGK